MIRLADIAAPQQIEAFCKRHHITRFSWFGSVLREDFGPESDIDVLVEFEKGRSPGLFGLSRMQRELSTMLGGRNVDLNTIGCLSGYMRDRVLAEAKTEYVRC